MMVGCFWDRFIGVGAGRSCLVTEALGGVLGKLGSILFTPTFCYFDVYCLYCLNSSYAFI